VQQARGEAPSCRPETRAEADAIMAACGFLDISLTDAAAELMSRHMDMVYEFNALTNLTRVPRDRGPELHVADSLSGLSEMERSPAGPWVDIGSGAGFPGVPLAIASSRHVDLIESVGKKAAVLSTMAESLCLDVSVLACRAEEAARIYPGRWSAVAARAVAPLSSLVELASPLLVVGGMLVCWKGALTDDEEDRGARVARKVGMAAFAVRRFRLPDEAERAIVVYRKEGGSSVGLPRRPGLAQRSPLA
jgi:16S rRNA (guanine527-N7)-methyltransferase